MDEHLEKMIKELGKKSESCEKDSDGSSNSEDDVLQQVTDQVRDMIPENQNLGDLMEKVKQMDGNLLNQAKELMANEDFQKTVQSVMEKLKNKE